MDDARDDQAAPAERPTRPWCLFRSGATGYAIGLDSVAEVVEVDRLVRLPHSPPRVLGLCSLRREVIPVIGLNDPDAAPAPPSPPPAARAGLLVMILRTGQGTWAVLINAEGTIVAEEGLDAPAPAGSHLGPVFLGTVRRGEAVYAAIDPVATWQNVRQGVEDWYCDRMGRDTEAPAPPAPAPVGVGAGVGAAVAVAVAVG